MGAKASSENSKSNDSSLLNKRNDTLANIATSRYTNNKVNSRYSSGLLAKVPSIPGLKRNYSSSGAVVKVFEDSQMSQESPNRIVEDSKFSIRGLDSFIDSNTLTNDIINDRT